MRIRADLLAMVLLAALLLTGCSSSDVTSLKDFLVDLGVPEAQAQQLAERLQQAAIQRAGEAVQQGQAQAEDLFNQFVAQVQTFRLELPTWARVALIVVGVILLLVGGRFYRAAVALPGFALGMLIGKSVLDLAEQLPDEIVWIIALVIGAVGGALALVVHDWAVAIIGGVVGGFLAFSLLVTYNVPVSAVYALIVGVCAVAGAIGLRLISAKTPVVMAAILGAVLVSIGLVENLNLAVIAPAAVIGLGAQGLFKLLRSYRPRAPQPEAAAPSPARSEPSQYPAYQPPQQQAYRPPAQPAPPSQPPQAYQPLAGRAFPPLEPEGRPRQATPPVFKEPVSRSPLPPFEQPAPPGRQTPAAWSPQPPSDQPTPPEGPTPADITPVDMAAPAAPAGASLTVLRGVGPAQTARITTSPFTIGGPGADLTLPGLAPVHATITASPAGYYLESKVSPYETLVNGRPARATYLSHGDVLRLGEYELRFHWPPIQGEHTVLDL